MNHFFKNIFKVVIISFVFFLYGCSSSVNSDKKVTELLTAIESAEKIYSAAVEGEKIGEYRTGAKEVLKSGIDSAKIVDGDETSSEEEIKSAAAKLNSVVEEFYNMQTDIEIKSCSKSESTVTIFGMNCYNYRFEFKASDRAKKLYLNTGKEVNLISKEIDVSQNKEAVVENYVIRVEDVPANIDSMTLKAVDESGNELQIKIFKLVY